MCIKYNEILEQTNCITTNDENMISILYFTCDLSLNDLIHSSLHF